MILYLLTSFNVIILIMRYILPTILVFLVAIGLVSFMRQQTPSTVRVALDVEKSKALPNFPDTDLSNASINTELILSGGPGKDGIPAISNPKFVDLSDAKVGDDVLGILVDLEDQKRFYPYNILVWHEIVNDEIGDTKFSVTFCPLCGSAIVFDRRQHEFMVSGYLFESNLLMYDRTTESLWSQSRGEAVVGDLVGERLDILPMQLITFAELKENHSDALVLSRDTGHSRDYDFYPYGDYEEVDGLIFPVSIKDNSFRAKQIMYVVPLGEKSLAIPQFLLSDKNLSSSIVGKDITISNSGGEIFAIVDGESLPGYYEMWFSWATHHQDDGIVWPSEYN